MRVLGLDSASPHPSLSLVSGPEEGPYEEDSEPLRHGAAELLVARVKALLTRSGIVSSGSVKNLLADCSRPRGFGGGVTNGVGFTERWTTRQ